jgi:transcriptional regulator
MMRPVLTREEYLKLRNGGFQKDNVARIRQGDEALKSSLVQMNYSCLPNDDGSLKGSKRMSTTVGMDIDHLTAEDMPKVKERILAKKDELGLDIQFSFEQAMQQSVAVKGANVNHNTVRQMLKNWRKQGLVVLEEDGNYRKVKS